jgi:hypothetical protein
MIAIHVHLPRARTHDKWVVRYRHPKKGVVAKVFASHSSAQTFKNTIEKVNRAHGNNTAVTIKEV